MGPADSQLESDARARVQAAARACESRQFALRFDSNRSRGWALSNFQFRVGPGHGDEPFLSPATYPELSLATTGTHDTEPLTVWWRAQPVAEREKFVRALGL